MSQMTSRMYVTIHARTGWAQFIVRVAQLLMRLHAPLLIPLWLRMMQPVCLIALCTGEQYRLVWPFRVRRWRLMRVPLPQVTVRITRKAV